jgi:TonB family protein
MNSKVQEIRFRGVRHAAMRLFQAAALAMLVSLALPARAADDRPVKQRVAPVYPEIAKRMKIGGEVKLSATVDATGKVTDVKTVSGNHMLSVAAEDAVRKWRFEAGAGEAHVDVAVTFNVGQ